MLQDFTSASALYLYPLLAGLSLGVLQIVVYFAGSVSLGDSVADIIDGTSVGELFDWLNFGRVPFSILGMLLLTSFGATGMLLDGTIPALPAWTYAIVAAPVAVGVTKLVGKPSATVCSRGVPGKNFSCIASTHAMVSTTPAAPSVWPNMPLRPLTGGMASPKTVRNAADSMASL